MSELDLEAKAALTCREGLAAPATGQIPTGQPPLTTRGLHLLIHLSHFSESPVLPWTRGGLPGWPGCIFLYSCLVILGVLHPAFLALCVSSSAFAHSVAFQ